MNSIQRTAGELFVSLHVLLLGSLFLLAYTTASWHNPDALRQIVLAATNPNAAPINRTPISVPSLPFQVPSSSAFHLPSQCDSGVLVKARMLPMLCSLDVIYSRIQRHYGNVLNQLRAHANSVSSMVGEELTSLQSQSAQTLAQIQPLVEHLSQVLNHTIR